MFCLLYQLGGGGPPVDIERGVLLESVAFRDGKPLQRTTTEPAPSIMRLIERSRFAAPVGGDSKPPWSQHRPQHVLLAEAQQLAPFTVLIAERTQSSSGG